MFFLEVYWMLAGWKSDAAAVCCLEITEMISKQFSSTVTVPYAFYSRTVHKNLPTYLIKFAYT